MPIHDSSQQIKAPDPSAATAVRHADAMSRAINVLKDANSLCILTGAGVSAESGIPTFRDKQTGLWENFKAEQLANIAGFKRDPELVWQWYQMRRDMIADKQPNPAHHALARWQQQAAKHDQQLTLISQNVDDLHEQAGSTVHKLHGSIWHNHCNHCHTDYTDDASSKTLITCPHCGGIIRPSVVWFGESLPQQTWQIAEHAASHCDVFLSIGTSSMVYPAAGLTQLAKTANNALLIEINPNPTETTQVDIQIPAKAGECLPDLVSALYK